MPTVDVNGISISYELIGEGRMAAVITPGGRYSKDILGVRELARALASHDFRVLIWDRPNCGASDICFAGDTESIQNADTLAALLRQLNLLPALLIGGSGASREALLTAIRHPEVVSRLFLFWISGGPIGLSALAYSYYSELAMAASDGGMQAVITSAVFKEQVERNPTNCDRLLAFAPEDFVAKLFAWGWAFFPEHDSPVPGIARGDFARIDKPVMVLRSSHMDMHHPRTTSEAVYALLPRAQIAEPPWDEREWPRRMRGFVRAESAAMNWPMLAPQIASFARAHAP
jgi:pimeloyl-ACP methyl ester carboxylesterase